MDTTSNTPEPEELSESSRVIRNPARKNIWTIALQLWAWLNVPFVGLAYYGFAQLSLIFVGFQQLSDVTTTPSSAPVLLALALGLVALSGSIWVAFSLSTSQKVGPTRRLIALGALMGANILIGFFLILAGSIFAILLTLLISVVSIQAWRSSYRKVDAGSVRRFVYYTVLFGVLFLPVTGAGVLFINTFLSQSASLSKEVRESAKRGAIEAEANMVWKNAQGVAVFETGEFNVTTSHITQSAEEEGFDYDSITGKLTTTNGVWYICLTGPQSQPC